MQEWNKQKLPKVLPGYSGGRLPARSTKEKGREEGEVDEDGEKRRSEVRSSKKWLRASRRRQACMKMPRRMHNGQSVKQNWDCSQIENEEEEEEEEEENWQNEDQMEERWAEDHKLEEILERRRMEDSTVQLEGMQKAPELVHERMTKGEEV